MKEADDTKLTIFFISIVAPYSAAEISPPSVVALRVFFSGLIINGPV
jgi:hypothetical protein